MKKLVFTYLYVFLSGVLFSQSININENNINDSIPIGKSILLNVTLKGIDSSKIQLLDSTYYKKNGVKFNLILAEKSSENELKIYVNSFDTGYVVLGPFGVVTQGNDTIFSNPILRYVNYPKIDLNKSHKINLDNVRLSLNKTEQILLFIVNYWWIWSAFIFLVLSVYAYVQKKKRKTNTEEISLPKLSLKEEYLNLLNEINSKELWQKGEIKNYHTEVTFAIRSYISKRYKIKALEKTSSQIASALKAEIYNEELKQKMTFLLNLSDLVKFAKSKPSPEENERIIEIAKEFIIQTDKTTEPKN